jgi:hypothetical protein
LKRFLGCLIVVRLAVVPSRRRKSIPPLFLALFAVLTVAKASYAANPPGSYQQTCTNVSVNGTTLNATCKNAVGQWASPSSLPNFNQCIGDIQNYNGQLHCNMGSSPPSGSYTRTCQYIFTSGTTLSATCKNAVGQWASPSSLPDFNQCIGDLQNYNGQLHCNMGSTPPSGSYTQTCQYIFTSGTTLNATCKNAVGQWASPSSLPDFNQCKIDIENWNGQLYCSPSPPLAAHIDFDGYSANGTPGVVKGSGFTNPQCRVSVNKANFLGPYSSTGNIVAGVPVMTPCVNTGQNITITVTSVTDQNQSYTFNSQCPNAQ